MKCLQSAIIAIAIVVTVLSETVTAQDVPPPSEKKITYSPYPEQTFPNRVYFGDTHLHTGYSTDAGMVGCILTPEDALRVSRGEEITSSHGLPVKLPRPLDFVVITDHAENLGLSPAIAESNADLLSNAWGKKIHDLVKLGTVDGQRMAFDMWVEAMMMDRKDPLKEFPEMGRTFWKRSTAAAEKYNEPGLFTAFIGFEWTSAPDGNNLHRNVIFRGGKDKADQIIPISVYDTADPEKLWEWMADYERKTGGQLMAIAHNGNISNGLMFDDVTLISKKPLDRDYAERRMRWEPLYEVTQIKGDGEAHPALSPNDEFADFETWDEATFGPVSTTPDMLPREYARSAYKRGLAYEQKLGVNPFKFGMIGSTDSHTGLPTTQEDSFFGKVSLLEPSADPIRFEEVIIGRTNPDPTKKIRAWRTSASGLAAVWSRENTREAIWDAMARKEVYATSGTRLKVRVFAGWDFEASDLDRSDFAEHGYDNGVPMGGDLSSAPRGKAPSFLVRAVKDPDGADLDRVQIIKGWLGADGETHEQIYDLAVSDGRRIGADGRCRKSVGNTVNAEEATYSNSIGDPYLEAFWQDPDFEANQRAFYYVRVIEIPTPRWTTFDAKVFGVELPEGAPVSIQERAYTSPIWYTPDN
ncbi:MAG: DUF3604 domain-containing protein [Planctomycetes bacterium]|nr:DUF3604 domain-containing protein [Planctomycetota bacterium]